MGASRLLGLMLFLGLFWLPGLSQAGTGNPVEDPNEDSRIEDEIIFQLFAASDLQSVLADFQLVYVDEAAGLRTYVAATATPNTSEEAIDQIVLQMMADPRVQAAEPHRVAEAPELRASAAQFRTIALADNGATVDDYLGQQAMDLIGASQATWDGQGVLVAVLDTGVGPHPILAPFLAAGGKDFIGEDDDPSDTGDGLDGDGDGTIDEGVGHGTHVAGIIHAIAPQARILPIRVMDSEGQGSVFAIARGIRYAVDQGADVINLSLGLLEKSDAVAAALEYAEDRVIIVVSAGNDGRSEPIQFPADDSQVIAVAATDLQDRKADFSNFNDKVSLTAPGVSILSLYSGAQAQYATWTGTSMAAPFVTGAMALARGAHPQMLSDDVADLVVDSAKDISSLNPQYEDELGKGRIDIPRLMQRLPPGPPPVPSGNPWILLPLLIALATARLRKIF